MRNPFRFASAMAAGVRQPIRRTPAAVGLSFDDVRFPSADGTTLAGWFIPARAPGAPLVVWVHGWPWNRAGNTAGAVPWPDSDVDLLPAARALHDAGFAQVMFDLASHGESARRFPLTHGVREKDDVAGAVAYARSRPEVDPDRVGLIGLSAGGSTALYAAPDLQPIRAIVAVQPTTVRVFSENMARWAFGGLGVPLYRSLNLLYGVLGAPLPNRHDPAVPAGRLGETVVQYVQGTGDPWGEMADVQRMSDATPRSLGVIAHPSADRYGGYGYIDAHIDDIIAFLRSAL